MQSDKPKCSITMEQRPPEERGHGPITLEDGCSEMQNGPIMLKHGVSVGGNGPIMLKNGVSVGRDGHFKMEQGLAGGECPITMKLCNELSRNPIRKEQGCRGRE